MKRLTITSVLMACLIGPAGALAIPADTHPVASIRAAAQSSSLGAGPQAGHYVGSTFVADQRSPDAQQPVTPAVVDLRSPDAQSPVTPVHSSPKPVSASPSSSDFDYNDAAIGAGSMLALALLALGAVMLTGATRRHRSTA